VEGGAVTAIEWTDRTWNPLVGCTRVSPGCEHCYAERFVHRELAPQHRGLTVVGKGAKGPRWTGEVRLVENALAKPLSWRKPQRVFVNSLSDLWHEGVSNETVAAIVGVMAAGPHLTFQVLTTRPERMRAWFSWISGMRGALGVHPTDPVMGCFMLAARHTDLTEPLTTAYQKPSPPWPLPNVWLGVTAEDQQRADERIPLLLDTPAAVRFVSYEPALGPVQWRSGWLEPTRAQSWGRRSDGAWGCDACCNGDRCDCVRHVDRRSCTVCMGTGAYPFRGVDWLIVGGESGPGARPFDLAWARSAVAQCREARVPVFVKQLGAKPRAHAFRQPLRVRDELDCSAFDLNLAHRKGADPSEWPADLRVRQFPGAAPALSGVVVEEDDGDPT
jgi:protein gp37